MDSKNANSKLAMLVKENANDESFPVSTIDYYDRFIHIDDYLNKALHKYVNTGPTAHEKIWLTDHGEDHISTVISRAADMVFKNDECVINPYEAYVLLLSIHFHDVGNILGRGDHEKRAVDYIFELDHTLIGEDTLEKRMIGHIAQVHGGYADIEKKDKDTIGKLPYDKTNSPKNVGVKKIAAILRFADELADDHTRTDKFVSDASTKVIPESEIFHAYADRLRSVIVDDESKNVNLQFSLNVDEAIRKFKKGDEDIYLFEEIFERTLKMYCELVYCSRFMLPDIVLERIIVEISVCTKKYEEVLGMIRYSLEESGYPEHISSLEKICPEFLSVDSDTLVDRVKDLPTDKKRLLSDSPVDLLYPNSAPIRAENYSQSWMGKIRKCLFGKEMH